ncbi:2,3-bisphosphoglycerate-independent phosphoglycerate mutase [Histomonas meleagridis]|uniref:2,3-bisphosphoglycerate-independent phosphoglycerate mutase n=1 Tax=Histomonas meleagridis TaxID=135588 RepID=UPI00355A677E|nr:2,3-bisphosphoglycerate-independent phosphoglycerate mutase [Histomonas meleagridis]KAH0801980.1 2,3-bisphosphoglycerate-independent phosphoglycerate mutase [Histomonas meleagridis]
MFGLFIFFLQIRQKPDGAVLCIIDGTGESAWPQGNGLGGARTPNLDFLKFNYPYASLVAAQQPVGLIRGEPGSSAVGHQTIGLGRTTPSYFQYLETSLQPNAKTSLINNTLLRQSFRQAKSKNSRVHFFGECTNSAVFAHSKFLNPMFQAAKEEGISRVYVHCMINSLTHPTSYYFQYLQEQAPSNFTAEIASVHSSSTAMDKNFNWHKTAESYQSLLDPKYANLTNQKSAEVFIDSFHVPSPVFKPILFDKDAIIRNDDVLVIFNFREDKTYQIAKAFIRGLDGCPPLPNNVKIVPLILYDKSFQDIPTVIPAVEYPNSLGSWISQKGFRQLRIAEKYKRPHVTTFFSGGILQPIFPLEERIIDIESVPDDQADLHPQMNASLVASRVITAIKQKKFKLIVVNFANVDATGHLGNLTAVKKAIEFVDEKVGEIYNACEGNGYALFVTGDHGNGEENINLDGSKQTDHTVNNVPFLTNLKGFRIKQLKYGKAPFLGNIAASILTALDIDVPPEMEPSILEKDDVYNYSTVLDRSPVAILLFLALVMLIVAIFMKNIRREKSNYQNKFVL